MPTYVFTGPSARREYSGKCPYCGKRTKRSRSFEHTVNPFSRNPDGSVKTWAEVRADVEAEADRWVPNFAHSACEEAEF